MWWPGPLVTDRAFSHSEHGSFAMTSEGAIEHRNIRKFELTSFIADDSDNAMAMTYNVAAYRPKPRALVSASRANQLPVRIA